MTLTSRRLTMFSLVACASLVAAFSWLVATTAEEVPKGAVKQEDAYYVIRFNELALKGGGVDEDDLSPRWIGGVFPILPYIVLDGQGEVCSGTWRGDSIPFYFHIPKGQPASGRVFCVNFDPPKIVQFSIPESAKTATREEFLAGKLEQLERLSQSNVPGAAWFRNQAHAVGKEIGKNEDERGRQRFEQIDRFGRSEMDVTFDLMSGGRALSENLQLDRVLPTTEEEPETVPVESIKGITVKEFDWTPLIKDAKPQTDPLARLVPEDQYAVFFPTFSDLVRASDELEKSGDPLRLFAEPRSESARVRERYERQLGLPMTTLGRLLGPQVIDSVAITGGDLYFRTGSDVAAIFETKNVAALQAMIQAQVKLTASQFAKDAAPVGGQVLGVSYQGMRSSDRAMCSYTAAIDGAVVVTNSLAQLERIAKVAQDKTGSLAKLDEYTFFRDRYKRGENDEIAFAVITDAAIRRWCGPQWRIATSRRTRAAALMSDLQAEQLDLLVQGRARPGVLKTEFSLPSAGALTLTPSGVVSSVHGSLFYHTPIMELDLEQVTKTEADLYNRWRNGYEQNWSQFFDPIAVRLSMPSQKLAVDLTVMPLIEGTDYRQWVNVSQGAKLGPASGDPHAGALLHFALALNPKSETLKRYGGMMQLFAPQVKVDPLSWIGESVAVYCDEDPFWAELAKAEKPEAFLETNFPRLPVVLNVEVKDGLKLTLFLAGLRAMIEQTAPNMTIWENKEHNGRTYVKISPTKEAKRNFGEEEIDLAIYYAPSGEALVLTLNEDCLKRAIDRQVARAKAKEEGKPLPVAGKPWLGENVAFQIERRLVELVAAASNEQYQRQMQSLAWKNLAILNEWKRLYPELDPVAVHEQFWQRRLICPGGGKYIWNEKWQTMESTVYGHPGEPKQGPRATTALRDYNFGNFGLTFEHDGLRARFELAREVNTASP